MDEKHIKIIKKLDIIVISLLFIASFIPYGIFWMTSGDSNYVYAKITVEGKEYKNIRLDNHKGEEVFNIKTSKGYNMIKVVDNKIAIVEADCPDKICLKPGYISKVGETAVCLPHKIVVEIKGRANIDDEETDFISG